MGRTCTICGKGAARANHVSHSNVKVPRKQKPNLQLVKVDEKSVRVCTPCRRTLTKKLA